MINKTFKYKLKLTNNQIELFEQWLGVTRLIYNLVKETSEAIYQSTGKSLSAYDAQSQIVKLKKEYDWMARVPKDTLAEPAFRYQKAMRRFYNGAKYPKWAKKNLWNSLVFVQQNWRNKSGGDLRINNGKIRLQRNILLNYFNSKSLPTDAKIKQVIITRQLNGWYASIQFETNLHQVVPSSDSQVVGIDMGIARVATLSTGNYYGNPKIFELYRRKLRIEQRSLARKKNGSNNFAKQKLRLARVYQKIARIKEDFQNKVTTDIVSKHQGFVVEALMLSNMTKSAKGTIENPGKNVKAKSGLNRSFADVSIGSFIQKLEYKSKWNERYFEKVKPSYTSQECNLCGHTSRQNRTTQSLFLCMNCGHSENADVNAAKNILKRGGHPHCSLTWYSSPSVEHESGFPECQNVDDIQKNKAIK